MIILEGKVDADAGSNVSVGVAVCLTCGLDRILRSCDIFVANELRHRDSTRI